MARWLDHRVPSMFHRRLLLLTAAAGALCVVLIFQMGRLTLAEGTQRRKEAERVLARRAYIPTARGRILDRRMRVLAEDDASHDVCVDYSVITGRWAYRQARAAAYRANRDAWRDMADDDREALIAQYQPAFDEQVQMLWSVLSDLGNVAPEELADRRRQVIEKVQQVSTAHALRRLRNMTTPGGDEPVSLFDAQERVQEEAAAHPLLQHVSSEARVQVEGFIAEAQRQEDAPAAQGAEPSVNEAVKVWSQVVIMPSRSRRYPLEEAPLRVTVDRSTLPGNLADETPVDVTVRGVGLHLIGTMRGVFAEDAARRPFVAIRKGNRITDLGGYRPDDLVGAWGIERTQEDHLRGSRGQVVHHLDTGESERLEPVAGRDVVLTIDAQLQARIQALMDPEMGLMKRQEWHRSTDFGPVGEPLNGAAVVLDVASGQVLAAVSVPSFTREQYQNNFRQLSEDRINAPLAFRAAGHPLGGNYQPGSTVKPLVLAAAVTEGLVGVSQTITCDGYLEEGHPDRYRCWIFKRFMQTHGPLTGDQAIAHSCNIYFYTMGRRLGAKRLVSWYERFGLGHVAGSGADGEVPGDLPNLADADTPNAAGFTLADATFMAIGQGPIRWTPLQAAAAYATLARGGYYLAPTFILTGDAPQRPLVDLHLSKAGIQAALDGLHDAVTQTYGTGHHINVDNHRVPIFDQPDLRVYGKSGTADAVALWIDDNGDGRVSPGEIKRDGDHAWFVALVQRPRSPRPDLAVAVVVEYAGSGGSVAGPILNQILHALRTEGYL